jgi:hypothetical protein
MPDLINGLRDLGAEAVLASYGGGWGERSYAVAVIRDQDTQWRVVLILDPGRGDDQSHRKGDRRAQRTPAEFVSMMEKTSRDLPQTTGQALASLWESVLGRMPGGYVGTMAFDAVDHTFATKTYSVSASETPNKLLAELLDVSNSLAIFALTKTDVTASKRLRRIQKNLDRIESNLKSNTY